jgi:hypothetical protein
VLVRPFQIRFFLLSTVVFSAGMNATAQEPRRATRILLLFQQQAEARPMVEFTQRLRQTIQGELKSPV